MIYVVKILSFMVIEFVFQMAKFDQSNFKRGVAVAFKVKNSKIIGKNGLKFCKLILWVIKQTVYKFSKL